LGKRERRPGRLGRPCLEQFEAVKVLLPAMCGHSAACMAGFTCKQSSRDKTPLNGPKPAAAAN
jgi:hypothetical protein